MTIYLSWVATADACALICAIKALLTAFKDSTETDIGVEEEEEDVEEEDVEEVEEDIASMVDFGMQVSTVQS